MRIVIDLQGAQAENRNRGIGRYARSLALGIVRNRGHHDVHLVLNGRFGESVDILRLELGELLSQQNIHVWYPTGAVCHLAPDSWHRTSSELLREAVISNLQPDIVLLTSLFEGLVDNAVTSVGGFSDGILTAVVLYDLIPYIYPDIYLERPAVRLWYQEKVEYLKKADLQLAISESTRTESIDCLGVDPSRIINISAAIDPIFCPVSVSETAEMDLRNRYDLEKPFVMYTGGIDHRKNIDSLICAFASLPFELRGQYQLAIVCAVQPSERDRLQLLAAECGLNEGDLILTNYVSIDDLLTLYNICHLFVFPSWHEGFGLPALEAMACGRAVVASNRSSLPEVIGRSDALFDPYDDHAIADKLQEVLCNSSLRMDLERHGIEQAARFSWDKTAKIAISSMERCVSYRKTPAGFVCEPPRRLKLAYVSPLPPERSGIADYSAELLPALFNYYDIEVILAQPEVSDSWISANCQQRTVEWFRANPGHYDRVLYHFGNSTYHQHMFDLAKDIPGVVVLHDFFISGLVAHLECHGIMPGIWVDALYEGHGYAALQQRFSAKDTADVVWKYPCNYAVLQDAQGVIVHSPYAIKLADEWYGPQTAKDWECIPLLRVSEKAAEAQRQAARTVLGFTEEQFVVCSFGLLGPNKLNHRLLDAWLASPLAEDERSLLVFVGENDSGTYGAKLRDKISRNSQGRRILITGWADEEVYRNYLHAADVGVQLRAFSRGETSAAVLDCMNHGIATIVNAHGSMADLASGCVWLISDDFDDMQLVEALTTLRQDADMRNALSIAAQDFVHTRHKPETCAEAYHLAIERYSKNTAAYPQNLINKIAEKTMGTAPAANELQSAAEAIDYSMPLPLKQRQLFVDISELAQRDAKSGIQRVVRSILKQWLDNPPLGYRVEPVYASTEVPGYKYAREYTLNFMGCPTVLHDEPVSYQAGDIFFGLDFQPEVIPAQREFFKALRRAGVSVKFCVYDLLLMKLPHFFVGGGLDLFSNWLEMIVESDGVICISEAVADELQSYVASHPSVQNRAFAVTWFHLGADIDNSLPSRGMPDKFDETLSKFRSARTFLMVGTLEPRKGHEQVLSSFDKLWSEGSDANLVIVGKQGWLVEKLVDRLRSHRELGRRLFWLEGASDELLKKIYQASTCLIAASFGEGFGLPLIEAAQHKLSIIARDIPVFHEVAGSNAYYFSGTSAVELAEAISDWLMLYLEGRHPLSDDMPWLTWQESAAQLKHALLGSNPPDALSNEGVTRV